MKVAAIQHNIVWENPAANFEQLAPKIADAAADGAKLIALAEMFSWGFSMNTQTVREPIGGPSTQFLIEQAERNNAWVCGSLPAIDEGNDLPFNQLIVAGPDGEVHRYNKMYPFTYGGEHLNYTPGEKPLTVTIGDLRVSFFICYDLRFSNEFWDLAVDTDLYVIVANWPAKRAAHWTSLLMGRAIDNQAHVLGVNRVGDDGNDLHYSGDSRIIDPFGDVLAEDTEVEVTLTADVDPARVTAVRERFPFLTDRR